MKIKKNIMVAIATLILSFGIGNASSFEAEYKNHNFNDSQKEYMQFACSYAKKTDLVMNYPDICYIFSAIIWQESRAGLNTGEKIKGHLAFGVFQNYLPTMRKRLKQKGINYSDGEIKQLLKDRYYSALFAEEELRDWLKYHKGDMKKAIASYYAGWNYKNGATYANDVMKNVEYLKKHGKFLDYMEF